MPNLFINNLEDEEIKRQEKKWGEQNHPSTVQFTVDKNRIADEYEIPTDTRAKFLTDNAAQKNELTWAHIAIEELCEAIFENDQAKRIDELIQLRAVIRKWIESIERNELPTSGIVADY